MAFYAGYNGCNVGGLLRGLTVVCLRSSYTDVVLPAAAVLGIPTSESLCWSAGELFSSDYLDMNILNLIFSRIQTLKWYTMRTHAIMRGRFNVYLAGRKYEYTRPKCVPQIKLDSQKT